MSIKAMSWYWENSQQDGHKLLLLLALADWSDESGECYPNMTGIAKRIRRKNRAAQLTVNELEEEGEILVHQGMGRGRDGQRSPLFYLLKYREAMKIETPPMIIEAARYYREQSRKQGKRGAIARRVQQIAPVLTATNYTPTGAADCTPPPATNYTPTGAADCTQIRHIDPSYRSVINEPPPSTIGTHRDHSDHDGGGSSTQIKPIAAAELKPAVKTTTTAPQADPRRKAQLALIAEIINDRLPSWNAHQSYAAALSTLDAWRLLTWLWVFDALARCAQLSPYDPDDIRETERIEGAYGKVFAGIDNPVGFIRARVRSGESTSLTAPDAAELEEAIVARAGSVQPAVPD